MNLLCVLQLHRLLASSSIPPLCLKLRRERFLNWVSSKYLAFSFPIVKSEGNQLQVRCLVRWWTVLRFASCWIQLWAYSQTRMWNSRRNPCLSNRIAASKTIHKGRRLIFKLRNMDGKCTAKSYSIVPLTPKIAYKGHAAGAESYLKSKSLPGKHIAAADGSKALQKAAATSSVPAMSGVSHLRFVFTPLATLPKKGMSQEYMTLLRQMVVDGIAKERKTSFVFTAGDNVVESIAAVSKNQLRRMGC